MVTNSSRKECMDIALTKHVETNFNFDIVNCLKKTYYVKGKGAQKNVFLYCFQVKKEFMLILELVKQEL